MCRKIGFVRKVNKPDIVLTAVPSRRNTPESSPKALRISENVTKHSYKSASIKCSFSTQGILYWYILQ